MLGDDHLILGGSWSILRKNRLALENAEINKLAWHWIEINRFALTQKIAPNCFKHCLTPELPGPGSRSLLNKEYY